MLGPRHEIARLQSDLYRDQYSRILRWVITAVLLILVLIAAIFYLILFKPTQYYYANTTDGKILEMPNQK